MNLQYSVKVSYSSDSRYELECLTNFEGAFHIYWNYKMSAQSIHSDFYMEVYSIDENIYIDISAGMKMIQVDSKLRKIKYTKDINYIKNMVKNLK